MNEDQEIAAELRNRVAELEKANEDRANAIAELQLQNGETQRAIHFLKRQIIEIAQSQCLATQSSAP